MTDILLLAVLALLLVILVLLIVLVRGSGRTDAPALSARLDVLQSIQERAEQTLRGEMAQNRDEWNKTAREQRQELTEAFKAFGDSVAQRMGDVAATQKGQLETFSSHLASFATASGERQDRMRDEAAGDSKRLREEIAMTLRSISETTTRAMTEAMNGMASAQKSQLESMSAAIGRLSESNEKRMETLKGAVESKLEVMRADNARQLEQMRQTVDEKLQGTLEKRLGDSFRLVSERLEQVHKGLGEMQSLATGVGDLKKVFTNVKTRGTWGEVQLGALLEQVLAPEQYATNVAAKDGGERVEFAVRLPGQGSNENESVWLPIDAKFPIEDYQRLLEAHERTDLAAAEAAGKQLENRVKACAKDICAKYLNPPKTTAFAILFLPIEGLFAEVIRRTALIDSIQRDSRVVVAGPTTLWALLNSLQMGFRTLAIEKRSSEVWTLLGAVKAEWAKYGDVLDKVQKRLHQASDTIGQAQVRSRAVGRKLKEVQELPVAEASALLAAEGAEALDEGGEISDEDNEADQ